MDIAFVAIGCIALGAACAWYVMRVKIDSARVQAEQAAAAAASVLTERLASRDHEIKKSEEARQALAAEHEKLHRESKLEVERRSAAEQKSSRVEILEAECARLLKEKTELSTQCTDIAARVQEERRAAEEKLALLTDAKKNLSDAFNALSAEALKNNNESFLTLAKTKLGEFQESAKGDLELKQKAVDELVKPIRESLGKVDQQLQELEKSREIAYQDINKQVHAMLESQVQLKDETGKLVRALRAPNVRGRWGEMQLKRVVEISGMLAHCDFVEQTSVTTEEGRLRPDLIVNLPGSKKIIVDSKAPLEAYLNALEAPDDASRRDCLQAHSRQIRDHISKLSAKSYWEQFESPEFVVMFLPGEMFFSAALEQDPILIEEGVRQRIIVASPTTLIALLRAVAYGWGQEKIAEDAQHISELGRDLYERLRVFTEHIDAVGRSLGMAVGHYNKAVGSFETRVLSAGRKFGELSASNTKPIVELAPLDVTPRVLQVPVALAEERPALKLLPSDKSIDA